MEARQTMTGSAVPKALLVALAMCAAILLAVGASFIGKDLTGSGSNVNSAVHPAPGTVLRQDYQGPTSQPLLDRGAERGATTVVIGQRAVDSKPGFRF